jgi:hypothetical protein
MALKKNTMEVCWFFIDVREYFKPGAKKRHPPQRRMPQKESKYIKVKFG